MKVIFRHIGLILATLLISVTASAQEFSFGTQVNDSFDKDQILDIFNQSINSFGSI